MQSWENFGTISQALVLAEWPSMAATSGSQLMEAGSIDTDQSGPQFRREGIFLKAASYTRMGSQRVRLVLTRLTESTREEPRAQHSEIRGAGASSVRRGETWNLPVRCVHDHHPPRCKWKTASRRGGRSRQFFGQRVVRDLVVVNREFGAARRPESAGHAWQDAPDVADIPPALTECKQRRVRRFRRDRHHQPA